MTLLGDDHARQAGAAAKRGKTNALDAVGDDHARQVETEGERRIPDARDAIGNGVTATETDREFYQRRFCLVEQNPVGAAVSSIGRTYRDVRQLGATTKRGISNAGDTVGDGHSLQAGTVAERRLANAGDAVGNV